MLFFSSLIRNINMFYSFPKIIDAFRQGEENSRRKLIQAEVGRREKKRTRTHQQMREDQLMTLCQDIKEGRKSTETFLNGMARVYRE